jgi:hypothetical protein
VSAILLFLALAVVAEVAAMIRVGRARLRVHGPGVLLWRWLTGMPHHGQPLTDAGWKRPGTRALSETAHVRRWWFRTRRYRAARRTGSTLAAAVAAQGLLFEPAIAVRALVLALMLAAWCCCWGTVLWWRGRRHHRAWTAPAHLVAAPLVGLPVASDPRAWLEVAPDRSRVVAILPPGFNPDAAAKGRLVSTLAGKLALESPEARWALAGPAPRLEITQSAPPPSRVALADVRERLDRLRPDELLWGLGKRANAVTSSLSGDSPHLGLSMGSGAGKSVTARSLLAQMLYRGAIGLVLDVKWISHQWATGLPNVSIVRRAAEIHAALMWLGCEVSRRNEVALAGADLDGNVRATVGPRLFVICEEMNATAAALRAHWREVREKSDPVRSPALEALGSASFMGRQVLTHLVYIGQRLSAKAVGDGDARENIGVIAFSRYSASNWKMLAGDHPMPPKNLAPGRLQVVSDVVRECQGILMTAAEARELATSGTVSLLPSGMPGAPRATGDTALRPALGSSADLRNATVSANPGPLPVSGWVSLREAVEAGLMPGLKIAGARTARHRDEGFPAPVGRDGTRELYDPEALASWAATRKE